MAEEINGKKVFSLYEVARSIQKTIADRYKNSYWIKAEMNKLNFYQHSGHCYPELVEKQDGKVIAQIRCNLWKDDYLRINSTFKRVLNEPLKDGIKILFEATIGYHPEHGLALRILDIDPNFTLGDLEREKQETIKRLQREGIFEKNRTLEMPLLPQRIAIISVQTSKGYIDFLNVFEAANRSWGYRFFHMLFPSLLQSEKAVQSIIHQLRRIRKVISHFDVVALVRGGGGDIGLSCYNNYELAREIAEFPVPVITGIGHATNETVVEMVAYENAITPTKLAEFLVQKLHNFSVPVQKAEERIIDKSRRLITEEKSSLQSEVKLFRSVTNNILLKNKNLLREHTQSLQQCSLFIIKNDRQNIEGLTQKIVRNTGILLNTTRQTLLQFAQVMKKDAFSQLKELNIFLVQKKHELFNGTKNLIRIRNTDLTNLDKHVANMSPLNVLKRGYSITVKNGKSLVSTDNLKPGDILNTILYAGNVTSKVEQTSNSSKQ